ncbi:MAG: isoprenylcysteine carboxylmethyltransferase family protein [Acidobacteriia bacterium]|nr:isoprenylcysteine carboxylmethyltransferase family protein [Terriglobia bacterium]
MGPVHAYLLAGLVIHKVLWEAMRLRAGQARETFQPIKAVKIAALAVLFAQLFIPPVLPIGGPPVWLPVFGVTLYTIGLVIAILGRVQLGNNWSNVESATVLPSQNLVRRGLYGHVRHPIYLGDVMLVIGFQLALGSWLVLLGLPLGAYVWRKARQEESLLLARLPGYVAYLASTGRFLPRWPASAGPL